MGFFDKLIKLFTTPYENQSQEEQPEKRSSIESSQIDDMQKKSASEGYKNKIYKKYYRLYPEKPFISMDREINTDWIEQAELFPNKALVTIDKMTRFDDGLLPGHIYLLYWIGKKGQKRVPAYFEYKYGIDFEKEKQFLIDNGYLENDKPTSKGADAIVTHFDVVEAHSPEATSAKKAQMKFAEANAISIEQNNTLSNFKISQIQSVNQRNLMLVSDIDKEKIKNDLMLLNKLLSKAQKALEIKTKLEIKVDEIVYNSSLENRLCTYFEYEPFTSSGKSSKYPFVLYFTTSDGSIVTPNYECFGDIGYRQDNTVGFATLNIWRGKQGYHIELGIIDSLLSVKRIDSMLGGTKTTIYKK